MKMFTTLSLITSYLMTTSGHPMILIALISTQTLIICLTLVNVNATSWFSFILFIVFMGGLMVLFVYVSSLASNEKFNFNIKNMLNNFFPLSLLLLMALTLFLNSQTIERLESINQTFIIKMYNPDMMIPTAMTMIYLLLALIIIVKITTLKEGPLRQLK